MNEREFARARLRPGPRPGLTESEAAALEGAGFALELTDLGTEEPLVRTAGELTAFLKASLSPQSLAARLGVSLSQVCQHLTSKPPSLYGIRNESGWVIPEFQLDGDHLLPGLGEVVGRLDPELHPLSVYRWFTLRNPDLLADDVPGPLSPREWLCRGLPTEPVAELAADL